MYIQGEVKYYKNGFIIKRIDNIKVFNNENYSGIEGDIWPIYDAIGELSLEDVNYLTNYISENIQISWKRSNVVEVSNNINFLNRYVSSCKLARYKVELLFCETEKKKPLLDLDNILLEKHFIFIGFDYGYTGGDYYSCVNSDIGRIEEFNHFRLNQYGLFDTEEEIVKFINLRSQLKKDVPILNFELGNDEDYTIYKLWKYIGDFPLILK